MMDLLYNNMINFVNSFLGIVIKALPKSPFAEFIANWDPPQYLGWLNWLLPVGQILSVTAIWLTAISAFYLISIIARWIKIIGN